MKNCKRILALTLALMMIVGQLPLVFAAEQPFVMQVSGGGENPHFADGTLQGGGAALTFAAGHGEEEITYLTDPEAVKTALRTGMKNRAESITFHYQLDYAFPTDQLGAEAEVDRVMEELFYGCQEETDDPTEGDSLRYGYRTWQYTGNLNIGADFTQLSITVHLTYFTTAAQEQELTQAVNALIDSFGFDANTDELTKIQTIYDYITENVRYDHTNLEDDSYILKFSAYAALINKTAVCEGYAVLFYRLAEEVGLDARVITGIGGTGADSNHAWNIVKLGDTYYYLDATWDEGESTYRYFLKGDSDFGTHTNDAKFDTTAFRATYPIAQSGYVFEQGDDTVYTDGNYQYTVSDGKATIVAYLGSESNIIVPATLGAYPVKYLGNQVFYGNQTVESITFSEGILSHGGTALDYCPNLTAVHYASTMQVTASVSNGFSNAPTNCPKLATITVAAGNPYMKVTDGILYNYDMTTLLLCPPDNGLTAYTVPDGVTLIAPEAFSRHNTLKKVVMPDSVITIGSSAFSASYELEEAAIPENCEYIGQYVYNETKVTAIHIPASLTNIRLYAFDFCDPTDITVDAGNPYYKVTNGVLYGGTRAIRSEVDTVGTVILPEGIEEMDNGIFSECKEITEIRLPSTLKMIGQHAFSECDALTHLTVPEGVTQIFQGAFGSCDQLVSIIIPDSLEAFDGYLFHPYNHTTVYGGAPAQRVAQSGGLNYKPLAEFVCHSGHNLQETVTEDNNYNRVYHYACATCGGRTMEYNRLYRQISGAVLTLSFTEAVYTGSPIVPTIVSVVYEGKPLTENVDYELNSPNLSATDVGTYHIGIKGIGAYRGYNSQSYTILHADIASANVQIVGSDFVYEGEAVKPDFTVTWGGAELTRYEDYGFRYENNNAEGVATLVVYGNQNFTGEVRKSFVIGEHQHDYRPTEVDENTHRGECVCGRTTAAAPHTWDNDCDYYCNDCYYHREVEHPWSDTWSNGVFNHYRMCTACGEVTDYGPHSGGTATCTSAAVCDVCHLAYGDPAPHDWDMSAWKSDGQYHYHPCKNCSAGTGHTLHQGGLATCTEGGSCADCGRVYLDVISHSYGDTWSVITAEGHAHSCAVCGAGDTLYPHTYNQEGYCTECNHDSGVRPAPKPTNPFTDVKKKDWYYNAVNFAVSNNLFAGTSPTTFGPNDKMTRAMFVTVLGRLDGVAVNHKVTTKFTDVKKNQYYTGYVKWGTDNGIVAGLSDTSFGPNANITREQICALMVRYCGYADIALQKVNAAIAFKDAGDISSYARAAVKACQQGGLVNGEAAGGGWNFRPKGNATRAEVATIIMNFVKTYK